MSQSDSYYPRELKDAENERLRIRLEALKTQRIELRPQDTAERQRVGLALSGGGMRSATFSLGFLQALAKLKLLREIDFLSTVSGGSYVGGFLGALFSRTRTDDGRRAWDPEAELTNPESKVLHWLRNNGRYLSPAGASDGWAALAVILRNMVAVNFMLWSLVFTVFVLLNLARGGLIELVQGTEIQPFLLDASVTGPIWWSPSMTLPAVVVPLFLLPLGLAYWLVPERKSDIKPWHKRLAALWTNGVLLAGASCVVAGWSVRHWSTAAGVTALVIGVECFLGWAVWAVADSFGEPRHRLSRWLKTYVLVFVALLVAALLDSAGQTAYRLLVQPGDRPAAVAWVVTGISMFMGLAGAARKLLGFLGSRDSNAGKSSGLGIPLQVLALVGALVLLLPPIVGMSVLGHGIAWGWQRPIEGEAGIATAAEHEPESEEELERRRESGVVSSAPVEPSGPVTLELEAGGTVRVKKTVPDKKWLPLIDPEVDWCWALVAAAAGIVVCVGYGRAQAFLNNSSIASLYAARLTRAYLGASNHERIDGAKQQNSSTDLLPGDRVDMPAYSPESWGGPLHIINATLNETVGGQSHVEERDRKGMNLAFGPGGISVAARHHAVWDRTPTKENPAPGMTTLKPVSNPGDGFRVFPATHDGAAATFQPEMLDLGRWIAISGAAASTGLGSLTSLGLSLLCGLLNVRLGHWWWSGVDPRDRAGQPDRGVLTVMGRKFSRQFPVQAHLLDEFLARFPGTASRNWYLTDGGHFENTGAYELIRRELPIIIVLDNGADPNLTFEDVAGLVRKARADFGAEIIFGGEKVHPLVGTINELGLPAVGETLGKVATYASLATITYASGKTGKLLLVKAGVLGKESLDILHYKATNVAFPQQTTADQFFDEAQWESYRKLGSLCGEALFAPSSTTSATPAVTLLDVLRK